MINNFVAVVIFNNSNGSGTFRNPARCPTDVRAAAVHGSPPPPPPPSPGARWCLRLSKILIFPGWPMRVWPPGSGLGYLFTCIAAVAARSTKSRLPSCAASKEWNVCCRRCTSGRVPSCAPVWQLVTARGHVAVCRQHVESAWNARTRWWLIMLGPTTRPFPHHLQPWPLLVSRPPFPDTLCDRRPATAGSAIKPHEQCTCGKPRNARNYDWLRRRRDVVISTRRTARNPDRAGLSVFRRFCFFFFH